MMKFFTSNRKIIVGPLLYILVGVILILAYPYSLQADTRDDIRFEEIGRRISQLNIIIPRDEAYLRDNPNADNRETVQNNLNRARQERAQLVEEAKAIISKTQKEEAAAKDEAAAAGTGCSIWGLAGLKGCLIGLSDWIGFFFQQVFGIILWLAGNLLELSISYSITEFKSLVGDSVTEAWKVLRDVANLFFIFILLYAAIGMILQLPSVNGKRILVSVIIVALLINFSAFFTRLVIDASNVAAYQFYKAASAKAIPQDGRAPPTLLGIQIGGFAGAFMDALPLAGAIGKSNEVKAAIPSQQGQGTGAAEPSLVNSIAINFLIIIMMLVATFIFLTAAILFLVRTVTLIFLIILSPLAFLMYAFPNQEGQFKKWWSTLFNQAFFAPLYLLMVYITLLVLKSPALARITSSGKIELSLIFLHFFIAAGLMLGSIIIAKSLGAKGASGAMGIGKKLAAFGAGAAVGGVGGWAGRNLVGRYGQRFAESETAARWAAKGGVTGWAGRLAMRGAEKTGKASFDIRASKAAKAAGIGKVLGGKAQKGGYAGTIEEETKREKTTLKKIEGKLGKEAADQYAETLLERPGAGQRAKTATAVGAGAVIGTAIMPGIGTAIGAGAGAVVGGIWRRARRNKTSYRPPTHYQELYEDRTGMKEKALTAEIAELEGQFKTGPDGAAVRILNNEIKTTEKQIREAEKESQQTGGGRSIKLEGLNQGLENKRQQLKTAQDELAKKLENVAKEQKLAREKLQREKSGRRKREETAEEKKKLRDAVKEISEEEKEGKPEGGGKEEDKNK